MKHDLKNLKKIINIIIKIRNKKKYQKNLKNLAFNST